MISATTAPVAANAIVIAPDEPFYAAVHFPS